MPPTRLPRALGEYTIVRLVGEGAMGKVYEARQESLQRRVALKVLPEDFARDPQALARFEREARAAAALHHPNIVQVYGSGVQEGAYYYAMEFVAGRSLRALVADEQAPLREQKKIAKYVLHTALALDYAHERGVIHRDVKPDNILVRDDDQAMVTDFGLARQSSALPITQAGALLGTPAYMAPEQALGNEVDRRSDVYGLGATLYECLTGRLPFEERDLRRLFTQIEKEPAPPLRSFRADVSPDLEAICLKALEKRPELRYPTAKAMGDDLIRFFRGDVALARSPRAWQVGLRQLRKHRVASALVGLAGALALGLVGAERWQARQVTVVRGEELVRQAEVAALEPLRRYREGAAALAAAREQAAAAPARAGELLPGALLRFRAAEDALLSGGVERAAAANRALELLHEALVLLPPEHALAERARALDRELLAAGWVRADRLGDPTLTAAFARELLALGAPPPGAAPVLLAVETDPPRAEVRVRQVENDALGCWTLGEERHLGASPVTPGLRLATGEYVVDLVAEGRVPARVPVLLRAAPGELEGRATLRVTLPTRAGVPEGLVWIAPGEAWLGGDPRAVRPLYPAREPEWVGGFFLARAETTVREYLEFLRALPPAERRAHSPPPFQLVAGAAPDELTAPAEVLEQPVIGVRLESARAYCRWRSGQAGGRITFRLPRDVEWEKAARGPRGRLFPWGDAWDPAAKPPLARLHLASADGPAQVGPVGSTPRDASLYGVLDLAGNVCEWVEGSFGGDPRFGVLRGGSWAKGPEVTRCASREPVDPSDQADFLRVSSRVGFRVAADPGLPPR